MLVRTCFLAISVLVGGCAGLRGGDALAPCETVPIEVVLKGSAVQNPSPEGQSMAVEVRVYALLKREVFDRLDPEAAQDAEKALGPDLLGAARATVFPDDEQIIPLSVPPTTRYVALVGLFRKAQDGWSRVIDVQNITGRCTAGGGAGVVRAQVIDTRLQAGATGE